MPFEPHRASERSQQSIHAAEVIHDNAASIAACCAEATDDEIVIVAIGRDHAFRGVWTVLRTQLVTAVHDIEDGGWTLTFSPGDTIETIESRSHTMAASAFKRWEATRRWASKHR